jgi:glycogen operon protein
MLLHGDEVARTQNGNNNAYCQDNELTWQRWSADISEREMLEWTKRIVAFRKEHPVLRRRGFFRGRGIRGSNMKDIVWFRDDGGEMEEANWDEAHRRALGVHVAGAASDLTDERGELLTDNSLIMLFNASDEAVPFNLPRGIGSGRWLLCFDTADPRRQEDSHIDLSSPVSVEARSLVVFRSAARSVTPS